MRACAKYIRFWCCMKFFLKISAFSKLHFVFLCHIYIRKTLLYNNNLLSYLQITTYFFCSAANNNPFLSICICFWLSSWTAFFVY